MAPDKDEIIHWLRTLQSDICEAVELEDGAGKFKSDLWSRPGGGGGDSRVMEEGSVIEKGGVNFSAVEGALPDKIGRALGIDARHFFATGVSIVMHPRSPHVPIIHMNVRYFETDGGHWWFGGGIDLTPHYVDEGQAVWFHDQLRHVCDRADKDYYPRFLRWANEYFYIRHRGESRGVSGIFYDRLNTDSEGKSKQDLFAFHRSVGEAFASIYVHLMHLNKNHPWTATQKAWQLHRRSRYVEFNLVYDKGTKFGLDTDGRIDSILMSLPPETGWKYSQHWDPEGPEMRTEQILRKRYVP